MPGSLPHGAEAFGGTRTARTGLTTAAMDASCQALAAGLTRMPDPGVGAVLQARGVAVHNPPGTTQPGLGDRDDLTGFAACVVSAPTGRQLVGSLLALGDRPVPWQR